MIHVVLNETLKEYWVADAQYQNKIYYYIESLKKLYGEDKIHYYTTDAKHLQEDLKTDIHRGYVQSHYVDWIGNSEVS